MSDCVKFTKFTHDSGDLSKRIFLDGNKIQKQVSANFHRGRFETVSITAAQELADYIATLKTNEALSYGVCVAGTSGNVATKDKRQGDEVARSRDFFVFDKGQPGILCLDYDAPKTGTVLDRDGLFTILEEIAPGLSSAGSVWLPSAGSCIYHGNAELIGVRGQRILVLVEDAADVQRAGKVLIDRLWQHGHGRIDLSINGSMLERTIFDDCVWTPEHLDFVAGSVMVAPLEQRRGAPAVHEGGLANTRHLLPDLSAADAELVASRKAEAKQAKESESKAVHSGWCAARAENLADSLVASGVTPTEARERADNALAQIQRDILMGDWPVVLASGIEITVGDLLRDKQRYDGVECRDPFEPEYQGGKTCAKLYLFGRRPLVHSFARGPKTYTLCPQPEKFVLSGRITDNVERVLAATASLPDIYAIGGGLAVVDPNGVRPLSDLGLVQALASRFAFYKANAKGEDVPVDFPERAAKMLLTGEISRWPALNGVLTAPFMTLDGRVVRDRGYDKRTAYFLQFEPDSFPVIPEAPNRDQLQHAYETLFAPFVGFPFDTDEDLGAMLAALLTAVIRPGLDVAPGFFFEAPMQGSGKTLLAECVKILATGMGGVATYVPGEEELRKMLVSWGRRGRSCIVFDNVTGRFSSGVLSGAMTSGGIDGERVLGSSTEITANLRMLYLATGNNASLDRDFSERWIRVRLDAHTENPSARTFTCSPKFEVETRRPELVAAALTILRGWHAAGCPDLTKRGCRFEQWNRSVRPCVLWLAETLGLPFGDPASSLFDKAADTETSELAELLQAFWALLDTEVLAEHFSSSDLLKLWQPEASTCGIDEVQLVYGFFQSKANDRSRLKVQSVTNTLRNIRDRPVMGLCLQRARDSDKRAATLWCLIGSPADQLVPAG